MSEPEGYCTVDQVKVILQIEPEDITYDDEIESCITSADALIDSLLKREELTVPASIPQNITDASAYYAAWLFRRRRDPTGAEAFWEEAEKFLTPYIEGEAEVAFKVGNA
jgi:hypothetical protein